LMRRVFEKVEDATAQRFGFNDFCIHH
jgi:hypothetical protein